MKTIKIKKEHLPEVNSTNLHASALLSAGKIDAPFLIMADFQTKGKGQGTNSWQSEPGKNLLISLVVCPENIIASEQFYLSKITAISIRDLISNKTSQGSVKIKWPNDILSGNEKIGGILIENIIEESKIRNSIIGVGINVNQTEFESFPLKATSLKEITKHESSISALVDEYIEIFNHWFDVLESRDFIQIDTEYLRHLYGYNRILSFSIENTVVDARIIDVEQNGHLVLLMNDNRKQKFGYKELQFVMK